MSYPEMIDNRDTDIASSSLATRTLTITDGKAQGPNIECRKALVRAEANEDIYIGEDSTVSAENPPVPNDQYLELTVSNAKYLFFAGTNTKKVYLILLP